MAGARREFPNKPDHVLRDAADARRPRELHPAFYGCFDWHSCVHGHWLLARVLKEFPGLPEAAEIRAALHESLSAGNIQGELAYLAGPQREGFERTYGWAWLLKLATELSSMDSGDAKHWSANLAPLAEAFSGRFADFIPKQTYPIRSGTHANTAFALAFALEYAQASRGEKLAALILRRSREYFLSDHDYPASWEPSGEDFLSPALAEADLMRRALEPAEFSAWFRRFLPAIPANLLSPALVADRSDPRLVHLDGLNLSRAWAMRNIASGLPKEDRTREIMARAALDHGREALANVASGHYEGEHWLATFAMLMLTAPEP